MSNSNFLGNYHKVECPDHNNPMMHIRIGGNNKQIQETVSVKRLLWGPTLKFAFIPKDLRPTNNSSNRTTF